MPEHTPIPWKVDKYGYIVSGVDNAIVVLFGCALFTGSGPELKVALANDHLVLEAVNNHDRLTRELTQAQAREQEWRRLATTVTGTTSRGSYYDTLQAMEALLAAPQSGWSANVLALVKAAKVLLELIDRETDLPQGAANGNVAFGTDEGVVMCARLLDEAKSALAPFEDA